MVKILSVGSVLLHHRVTPPCWTLTRLEGVIRVSEQQWERWRDEESDGHH